MTYFTTRQAAEKLSERYSAHIDEWQVRRLFESGLLPEPPRFSGKRMIAASQLVRIADAMRKRGWIPETSRA